MSLVHATQDNRKRWKDIPYLWIRRINIFKVIILP